MISHFQDHAINGIAVLPMTQVIEWFLQVARSKQPGIEAITLTDIVVLKGVLFEPSQPLSDHRYEINCRHESNSAKDCINMQLLALDGTPHYQAKFNIAEQPEQSTNTLVLPDSGHAWPYSVTSGYQEKLFHGPRFQVIQQLDTLSDQGGSAFLDAQLGTQWPNVERCISNPVLLDGGLQLLLLWAFEQTGKTSLPTAIGECRYHGLAPITDIVACHFKSRLDGQFRSVSDCCFSDSSARVLAEFRDVEMHLLQESNTQAASLEDRV